jgi:hypothetical protein
MKAQRKNRLSLIPVALCMISLSALAMAESKTDSVSVTPAAIESLGAALSAGGKGIAPEIAGKMSGDQIVKALKDMHEFRLKEQALQNKNNPAANPLIPVVAIGGFFTMVVLIVLIPLLLQFRKNRLMHETLRSMVEKGAEIPPALLIPPEKPKTDLRRGILGITEGVGISLFFLALNGTSDKGLWAIGLIPFSIGVGYLLLWKLARRNDTKTVQDS